MNFWDVFWGTIILVAGVVSALLAIFFGLVLILAGIGFFARIVNGGNDAKE